MERDNSLDLLKGIAIFLVVLGHLNVATPIENFIYSFHMSLFMFISGCTFWYSYKKSEKAISYVLKRFHSLIIPYIVWGFFYYWFYFNNNFNLFDFINYPFSSDFFNKLWFLPTLFCIIVVAVACMVVTKHIEGWKKTFLQIVVYCFGICFFVVFSKLTDVKLFRQCIIYSLPFFIGLFMFQYETFKRFCIKPIVLTGCFVIFVICLSFYSIEDKSVVSLTSRLICGITFVIPLYIFVNNNELYYNSVWIRCIRILGKNTIGIYAMQEFFRPLFANSLPNAFYDTLLKSLSAIIICIIIVFIKKFVETISPVLSFLMFGTKLKRNQEF